MFKIKGTYYFPIYTIIYLLITVLYLCGLSLAKLALNPLLTMNEGSKHPPFLGR